VESAALPAQSTAQTPSKSAEKILVIDDDPVFRQVIADFLATENFQIIEAGDGEDGVRLAREHRPQVILCDLRMERRDGYSALAEMRSDPATGLIPVILMSGQADRAAVRKGMRLGADDFLTKPFSVADLLEAVDAQRAKRALISRHAEERVQSLRDGISLALPRGLNAPLDGILGFAEVMAEGAESLRAEEIRQMAEFILVSGRRLDKLTRNFLVYAQIELSKSDPPQVEKLRAARTRNIFALLSAALRAEAGGRAADLRMELDGAALAISEDYLKVIITEIAGNALKFSRKGSPIQLTGEARGNAYLLRVSDQGCGLTGEQVAALGLSGPFGQQLAENDGRGLGLIIARGLAELHGGSLSVASQPGQGTVVEIQLPVAPRALNPAPAEPSTC